MAATCVIKHRCCKTQAPFSFVILSVHRLAVFPLRTIWEQKHNPFTFWSSGKLPQTLQSVFIMSAWLSVHVKRGKTAQCSLLTWNPPQQTCVQLDPEEDVQIKWRQVSWVALCQRWWHLSGTKIWKLFILSRTYKNVLSNIIRNFIEINWLSQQEQTKRSIAINLHLFLGKKCTFPKLLDYLFNLCKHYQEINCLIWPMPNGGFLRVWTIYIFV